jgi:hypothetical protein
MEGVEGVEGVERWSGRRSLFNTSDMGAVAEVSLCAAKLQIHKQQDVISMHSINRLHSI